MLVCKEHGPVTELRLSPEWFGRPVYRVSAYFFDGTLIDSGPPRTAQQLARWAESQPLHRILNTHHHEDHIGGNAYLDVPAFAPAETVVYLAAPERIPLYRRMVWGQPRPARATPLSETAHTDQHTLQVIPTPGQAPDHVAFLLAERGWLFSGDLYISERTKVIRRVDDVPSWLASLHCILQYDFDTLFCGHAGRVPKAKDAIRRKIAYWEELQAAAHQLAGEGLRVGEIRQQLLGREGFITYWSAGRYSKRNLITALLSMPEGI